VPTTMTPRHCACGVGNLSRGVRYGPGPGQRTEELLCLSCSYEEPSLYGRSRAERNGGSHGPGMGRKDRPNRSTPGDWMPGRLADGRFAPGRRR
jgi:hypothetical protein